MKSLNNVINYAEGDYILFFAADDKLYDDNVINNFIKAFDSDRQKKIITSQCLLYDSKLEKINAVYVDRREAILFNKYSPHEQYVKLCDKCLYGSGGTAYRKDLLLKYNCFDESYKHVEDWSNWLRFLRNGEKIYYADFICFESIIVELKAVSKLINAHKAQLINYLNAINKEVGLLINFGEASLKW